MKVVNKTNSLLDEELKSSITPKGKSKGVKSSIEFEHTSKSAVDPKDVIAWLLTQPNANGMLYLESVVQKYMSALSSTPGKLQFHVTVDLRSVFTCRTPDELNSYWDILKAAPNYKQVNRRISGMFSAGMGCYMRYLQHIADEFNVKKPGIIQLPKLSTQTPKPDSTVVECLTEVLSSHFANGYRLNSSIELARFRSFASTALSKEITLTDKELKTYISDCGITFDGKVYAVPIRGKERIKNMVEEYFAEGAISIFFTEFYAKNENWLFEVSIVSEDMLIEILRTLFPKLSFTRTYFGYADTNVFAVIEDEILRVWGDDVLLTYGQLAERLQYIPLDRIKSFLGRNSHFIWNSVDTYSHVSRIVIAHAERHAIREAAMRECSVLGYASISDLPFGEIKERNCELSITAFYTAIYRICLSDKFDKKGRIVVPKGDTIDALTIMKKHCRTIDKCSLEDLLSYEKELTGEVHRWISIEAGNTDLIRIDKNAYVADRHIHFNTDVIDQAIGLFVKEEYLPLKSFTTFGVFPDCGQTWNLFVLESYCRRFSREFRFDTPSINSRNAGAVVRKSCGMNYVEIMTDAVVNAEVPLKDTSVSKFLYDSGYMGRCTSAKANEIIDKAKAIRERRN